MNIDDASDDAFQLPSNQVSCPYNLTLHFPCKEKDQFTSKEDIAVNNNSVTSNHFFNKAEDNRKFSFLLKLQRGNIKKKMQINKSVISQKDSHTSIHEGRGMTMSVCIVSIQLTEWK